MAKRILKNNQKQKTVFAQCGFTLVEIAIVLVIVGSMISISISAFLSYEERSKIRVTKQRLATIQESMEKFLEINGRYPCVAPFTMRPEDAGFGFEGDSDPNANNHSCQAGTPGIIAIAGTANANSANPLILGNGVRLGVVPVRTLNLPDEFAIDAWGGTLTYAVVRRLATEIDDTGNPGLSHAGGSIRITDVIGDSVISPINSAHYIVLSHGSDQLGARVVESNNAADVKNPCVVATDTTPLQQENCDNNDAIFIVSSAIDDLAVYDVQRRRDNILPIGTVLAFDSSDCPDGWIEYFGDTTSHGSFLLGVDDGPDTPRDEIFTAPPTPIPPTVRQIFNGDTLAMDPDTENRGIATGEYQLGDIGEDGVENISPYLTLRYCMKQ